LLKGVLTKCHDGLDLGGGLCMKLKPLRMGGKGVRGLRPPAERPYVADTMIEPGEGRWGGHRVKARDRLRLGADAN
jgi:hypothetical protein